MIAPAEVGKDEKWDKADVRIFSHPSETKATLSVKAFAGGLGLW
jgi:hypothetical protein